MDAQVTALAAVALGSLRAPTASDWKEAAGMIFSFGENEELQESTSQKDMYISEMIG